MISDYVFLASIRPQGYELYEWLQRNCTLVVNVVMDREPGGYWKALNRMIRKYQPRRFVWLSDDCRPKPGWFIDLLECWHHNIPDNYGGLIVANDLYIRDAGAAFAMTSPDFLKVIFGKPRFPGAFVHNYLDTLIADRAKDLGRYFFCEESIVEHLHWKNGKAPYDEFYERVRGTGDKAVKDRMDAEWQAGGCKRALKKLGGKLQTNAKTKPVYVQSLRKASGQAKNQSRQSKKESIC